MRTIFAKGVFLKQSKKKILKKFCSSEKQFYNSHVLESQTNGKQVRRKPIFEAWKIKNSPVRFGAIK